MVRLPTTKDPRLKDMRVRWVDPMAQHCGQLARVTEVRERCIRAEVEDVSWGWDTEVRCKLMVE